MSITWLVLASGPSVTNEDIALINSSGLPIVATNEMWRRCNPDVIYAADASYWKVRIKEIPKEPQLWTCSRAAANTYHLNYFKQDGGHSSGSSAIRLAAHLGARRIIAAGIDCGSKDGRKHSHPDHTDGLRNPSERQYALWRNHFNATAKAMKAQGVEVINASRWTTLNCFPRMELSDALHHSRIGAECEGLHTA